ncbi:bifunctional adenosylcobinamide kinase/adenosylcobinamide-phosphate guanylyltransferase [Bauldia litoralis]|uniref:bifunctional adenosylcobinamide kinase/adenosylcobinamide-phosphate guanylyltransferase n=1 Tax=Bauldia litoralis TaxID=665467 RepID=UPI00326356AF
MAGPGHLLIVGGQRSGKSRHAEACVAESGLSPVYIATAQAGDGEMAERIATHRARRGPDWHTIEEPLDLPEALAAAASPRSIVLVDCLTLWLSNLMHGERDIETATDALLASLADAAGPVVLVSNEVGSGIIPANPLSRRYADAQGVLNQTVAASVPRVVLMAAGIPLQIKPASPAGVLS